MTIDWLFFRDNGPVFAFTAGRGVADALNPYSGFNCCGYVGDDPVNVARCRHELCSRIGIPTTALLTVRQVHGTDVVTVTSAGHPLGEADALVTNLQNVAIGVFTADCVPMLFYDRQSRTIGAAHAGWKGTMNGIAVRTIEAMLALGATAGNLQALFGPSICRDCFEVGDEVVEMFRSRGLPIEKLAVRNPATGKAHIDLAEANAFWMRQCGLKDENIVRTNLCTKCNPTRYYSARNLGTASGRNLTALLLA